MPELNYRVIPGAPQLDLDTDELARDYDRISATRQFEFGKQLVADLGIRSGERVLNIGARVTILRRLADIATERGIVQQRGRLVAVAHRR